MDGNGLFTKATEHDKRVVMLAQELFLRRAADLDLDLVGRDNYNDLVDEATNALMGADAFLTAAQGWVAEKGEPKRKAPRKKR